MYEIELHYPATQSDDAHIVVIQTEASCITELANIAYRLQMQGGYRVVKNILTGKTRVVGLQIEHVSFGPVIEREENGLPKTHGKSKR